MITELYFKDSYLSPRNRNQQMFVRETDHVFKIHPLGIYRCELPIYNTFPNILFNFTPHKLITRKCNRIRACIKRQINIFIVLLVRDKSFQMGLYALWVKNQKVNTEHIFNEESQQHLMARNASPAASGLFCCIGC